MKLEKLVVYDPNWQAVRIGLLDQWTSNSGIHYNFKQLNEYLGDLSNVNKLYQVINLLNAVRMSFHSKGLQGSNIDNKLTEYRRRIQKHYKLRRNDGATLTRPVPDKIARDWERLSEGTRKAIIDDLEKRASKATRAERPELYWFLDLVKGLAQ